MVNPTLDEDNATNLATFEALYTKTASGVNCNDCETELKDIYPGVKFTTIPPQTPVICDGCGFKGYRIV